MGERLLRKLNGKLRDELLNGEIFCNLKEAKIVIEQWRRHYNEKRPHSSHGYRPPAPVTFGKIHPLERAPAMQWSLTRLGSRSRSGQRRRAHARRAWVRGGCPSGLIGGAGLHYPSQRGANNEYGCADSRRRYGGCLSFWLGFVECSRTEHIGRCGRGDRR
ncbi:MAG: transposase [Alphaproteobacteria bacterium]|nr:transposase [Alphaproteobacteria bacterium]